MTEITDSNKINWPAFVAALLLGPITVTLILAILGGIVSMMHDLGGVITLVAVFSLILGVPFYLVTGTPALIVLLQHRITGAVPIAVAALAINALLWALQFLVFTVSGTTSDSDAWNGLLLCGLIFAPLWGASFAILYDGFAKLTKRQQP